MKQLQTDPWDGVEAKYPVGRQVHRPHHQHHRLRRLRGAGSRRRRPGARLGNVAGPRRTSTPARSSRTSQEVDVVVLDVDAVQAPHLARPQAGPGQSVGRLRGRPPDRLDRRRRGQERHRVRSVHRPRQRHRRHGAPVRHRLERAGRRSHRPLPARATWSRPRCSTSTSRRNASRSASSSSAAIRWQATIFRKGQTVTVDRDRDRPRAASR